MATCTQPIKDWTTTLECPVCMLLFKNPKQLACGHTYCGECVDKLVEMSVASTSTAPRLGLGGRLFSTTVVSCPQCRKQTMVPKEGLNINFSLRDMVAKLENIGLQQEMTISCVECSASEVCTRVFLCRTCTQSGSVVTPFDNNFFLCSFCALTVHKEHDVARCSDFASREDCARASAMLLNSSNFSKTCLEKIAEEQVEVLSGLEQTRSIISREFQLFHSLIDSTQSSKLTRLKSQLDEHVTMGQELNTKFQEAYLAFVRNKKGILDELSELNMQLETMFATMRNGHGSSAMGGSVATNSNIKQEPSSPGSAYPMAQQLRVQENNFAYAQSSKRGAKKLRRPRKYAITSEGAVP